MPDDFKNPSTFSAPGCRQRIPVPGSGINFALQPPPPAHGARTSIRPRRPPPPAPPPTRETLETTSTLANRGRPCPLSGIEMSFRDKILSLDQVRPWRDALRAAGKKLAVTNGRFDILHVGHVTYLEAARQQGDALLVGLNSDSSVRKLKGEERPLNSESDRAAVLAALESVTAVCVFPEIRATRFLSLAQPDIYVKGGDLSVDQLPEEERDAVARSGGRIVTIGFVPGRSTTA